MDVPCSALGDDVGVPVAVLFALVVLLSVANGLVRNGEISNTGAVNAIISCQGHPSFQGVLFNTLTHNADGFADKR